MCGLRVALTFASRSANAALTDGSQTGLCGTPGSFQEVRVVDEPTDRGAGLETSLGPSHQLLLLLRKHAAKVAQVRTAESRYRSVRRSASAPETRRATRATEDRVSEAFGALADAVVGLHGSQLAVEVLAKEEGLSLEAVCALDEGFALASREHAGYLAARTYEQVREASNRETPVETIGDAAAHPTSSDLAT